MQDSGGLVARKKILNQAITPVPYKLEVEQGTLCHSMAEVVQIFE